MLEKEIWTEITGFENKYFISNHGRLKSINGKFKNKFPEGYTTIGTIDSVGYRVVTLRKPPLSRTMVRVHTLVATYYCEKPDGSKCVNHLDGNPLNNYYLNLEWTTPLGNSQHAIKMGLFDTKGENHFNSKLTREDVLEMRRLYFKDGFTQREIGERFGVSRRHTGDVINGVNWGWLT